MASISSLSELLLISPDATLISFDVFDTLLYRRFLKVNEVHDLASAYALSLTGHFGKRIPGDLTLTRPLVTENMKASPYQTCEEPALPMIWATLLAGLQKPDQNIDHLAKQVTDFEFSIDAQNLYAVKGARETLAALKEQGKRLVAISDMYFSEEQVSKLLENVGLLQYFDHVYVSASENLTKQTGNLFLHVWKDQDIAPENTLHIGDNPVSDLERPEEMGGHGLHLRQEKLCRTVWPNFGHRPIYQEMSDLIKVFLFQLYLQSCSDSSDCLYFMSRDGILLKDFLTQWKNPLLTDFFPDFDTETLYLSRATACWLNIDFTKDWLEQAIGHIFWLNSGKATPRQISAMFGIPTVPSSLEANTSYHSDRDTHAVVGHYRVAGLEADIKQAILKKRQDVLAYLDGIGFFKRTHAHVSDVGYSGTVLRDLNSFFLQEKRQHPGLCPPRLYFHCLATNNNHADNAMRSAPYVNFHRAVLLPHDSLNDDLKDTFSWLEYFFKHPTQGPLLGFRHEKGRTVPDYNVTANVNPKHPFAQLLAQATTKPEDIILLWMAAINFPNPLRDPLLNRFSHPDFSTISQMSEKIYEADAVHSENKSIIYINTTLPEWDLREVAKRRDAWIGGSLFASRLAREKGLNLLGTTSAASVTNPEPVPFQHAQKTNAPALSLRLMRKLVPQRLELAKSVPFDPDFYRKTYPDLAYIERDSELERHFRLHGHVLGRFGTLDAVHAYARKHGLSVEELRTRFIYPLSFPEKQVGAPPKFPTGTPHPKTPAALPAAGETETAPATGGFSINDEPAPSAQQTIARQAQSDLWVNRARHAHHHGRHDEAIDNLQRALKYTPDRGALWHELGDWLLARNQEEEALSVFEAGISTASPNRWSFFHAVRLSGQMGHYSAALRYLEQGKSAWQAMAPWRDARQGLFQNWFEHEASRLSARPPARLKAFLIKFAAAMSRTDLLTPLSLARADGPVCILVGSPLDERTLTQNNLRSALPDGRRVLVFSMDQVDAFRMALPGASLAIFNHVVMTATTLKALLHAKRLGLRTLFWAGPMADGRPLGLPDLSDLAFSDFQREGHNAPFGARLLDIALALFSDDALTTLPALLPALHDLNTASQSLPSALGSALLTTQPFFSAPALPGKNGHVRTLFVILSNRPAYKRARQRQSDPKKNSTRQEILLALAKCLAGNDTINLHIEGVDNLEELPSTLRDNTTLLPGDTTDEQRLAFIAGTDLVLDGHGLAGTADMRQLWAASPLTNTAILQLADEQPDDAPSPCRLSSLEALTTRLPALLTNPDERRALIEAATTALETLTPARPDHGWAPLRALPAKGGKPRILFANIYAPPQVIGGATRVLMDNLSYFRTHAGALFDPYILTSDNENANRGESQVDSWEGLPVFRMATPQEVNMDWRTYNAEVETHTRRVLALVQPDLVHIHCLTRLSVAVAEACQALGIPYIVTLHDAWWVSDFAFLTDEDGTPATLAKNPAGQSFSHRIGLPRSLERAVRLRAALLKARMILGVSESFSALFRKLGFTVQTMENGVSALPPCERIPGGQTVRLGHLGGLEPHKGAYLLEAALRAGKFNRLSLTIIDHAMASGVEQHVRWGETDVTIRGKLPANDIARLYAGLDVLVAPSTWPESYGLVAREAAFYGCWVIANKDGAMGDEVIEGKNGFLVNTTDGPKALQGVLAQINANPARYQAPPAQKPTLRRAETQAQELLGLYRTLLGRG